MQAQREEAALANARRVRLLFDGERLRLARELRLMTQEQLGQLAGGISGPAISQFEQRRARPSARTLEAIAAVLDFPVGFFMRDARSDALAAPAFFRSLRATSGRQRRSARARAELIRLLVLELERHVEFPPVDVPRHPASAGADRRQVERAATEVRERWGFETHQPIPDVVRAIEQHGVVCLRVDFDVSSMDAFSVPYADRPVIILCADKGKRDRSRFDAAHELGHLVMHSASGPAWEADIAQMERQANQFAAALLMPEAGIRHELPTRADWEALASLKRKWGTSMAALLYRARTLGVMTELDYVRATKAISARGWRVDEPMDLGSPESPMLLNRAIGVILGSGRTLEDLGRQAGIGRADIELMASAAAPDRPRVFG